MAFIALLILAMGGVSLVGAWLIGAGFRGRPVRRRPVCAACLYDLTGHDVRPDVCPECGRPLDRLGAVKVVHRRWCRQRLGIGTALVLLAFSPTALALLPAVTPALPVIGPPPPPPPPTRVMRTRVAPAPIRTPAPRPERVPSVVRTQYAPNPFVVETFSDGAVTIGGYGGALPQGGLRLMEVPPEPGTWERRRGALHDLPSGPDAGLSGWMQLGLPLYPSVTVSRDGSHTSTLLRR